VLASTWANSVANVAPTDAPVSADTWGRPREQARDKAAASRPRFPSVWMGRILRAASWRHELAHMHALERMTAIFWSIPPHLKVAQPPGQRPVSGLLFRHTPAGGRCVRLSAHDAHDLQDCWVGVVTLQPSSQVLKCAFRHCPPQHCFKASITPQECGSTQALTPPSARLAACVAAPAGAAGSSRGPPCRAARRSSAPRPASAAAPQSSRGCRHRRPAAHPGCPGRTRCGPERSARAAQSRWSAALMDSDITEAAAAATWAS
jgi:hypothetical protein